MENENKKTQGFVRVPRKLVDDLSISLIYKGIYTVIRSFVNEKTGKDCYPSQLVIAQKSGKSISTVKRAKRKLKETHHLSWVRGRKGRANVYSFSDIGSPLTLPAVTNEQGPGPYATTQQEPLNKKHYQGKNITLLHRELKCFVKGGEILISNWDGRQVKYGGGDDEGFEFGQLKGAEARRAAEKHFS